MNTSILIIYLALNPCPLEGHPTIQTQSCIKVIPIVAQSLDDCLEIEKSFSMDIKSRWPQHVRNLYFNGGGSRLSYLPCEEIV